jgi:uncharacterized protein
MIVAADTNLFLYVANPDSPQHTASRRFFEEEITGLRFLLGGLVLVEIYMQLRNPAVFKKPRTPQKPPPYVTPFAPIPSDHLE